MRKNSTIKIFIISLIIVSVSTFIASKIMMLDPLFLSLLLGILLSPKIKEKDVAERLVWIVLPIGIALYGINMRYVIPLENVIYPIVSFITIFFITYFLMWGFGFSLRERIIASSGCSVCGVSAIVIVSPIIGAERKEVGRGILNLTIMGIILYAVFTAIGAFGNLARDIYGIIVGSIIPMVCFVTVAGMHQGVVDIALGVKGIRMDMILVIALALSIIIYRSIVKFPWFIFGFMFFSLTAALFQNIFIDILKILSKFMFSLTLALIGLSLDVEELYLKKNLEYLASMFIAFMLSTLLLLTILGVTK